MNDLQLTDQSEIEVKIKEAETCYSMGMLHEAVSAYEQVLNGLSGNDGQIRETIRAKINQVRKEIEVQETTT